MRWLSYWTDNRRVVDDVYDRDAGNFSRAGDPTKLTIEVTASQGVLANDRAGVPDSPIKVYLATPPQHAGDFTLNDDGSFVYQPGLYTGSDSFS